MKQAGQAPTRPACFAYSYSYMAAPTFKTPRTFYILDGHAMAHRAFHAPFTNLSCRCADCEGGALVPKDRKGERGTCKTCLGTGRETTKVTYMVVKQIMKLVREKKPTLLAMAVDVPRHTLERRKLYPAYKDRPSSSNDLHPQIERTKQIVQALGIPVIQSPGHEADDVIATLVDVVKEVHDIDTVIVGRDKDLMQLIGQGVRMYDPMTEEFLDGRFVNDKFGIDPWQLRDYLSLVGDTSDNIPGVKGVGPKGAAAVLKKFGKVDKLVRILLRNHAQVWDAATLKVAGLLREHMEDYFLSKMLVRLNHDVPLPEWLSADSLHFKELDLKRAKPLFRMLNFKRFED